MKTRNRTLEGFYQRASHFSHYEAVTPPLRGSLARLLSAAITDLLASNPSSHARADVTRSDPRVPHDRKSLAPQTVTVAIVVAFQEFSPTASVTLLWKPKAVTCSLPPAQKTRSRRQTVVARPTALQFRTCRVLTTPRLAAIAQPLKENHILTPFSATVTELCR